MTRHFLEVSGLGKRFGRGDDALTVFDNVNFTLEKGEFVCIIGHSGCGKSTILNTLAGLDSANSGGVVMNGREVSGPSLDRGVVFQNYSLLPWLTAFGNVAFAVRARWPQWNRQQVTEHSRRFLEMVGLKEALERKPAQLSGGMRQRVSIARAFATQPQLLLLDEPFGALDALTRGVIQEELMRAWSATQQTVFMITHDVDEAILLADRVFLMTNGPNARIAESVRINLPRPRARSSVIHQPGYYAIRNHLVDFLVNRSTSLRGEVAGVGTAPLVVDPTTSGDQTAPAALNPPLRHHHLGG